MQPPKQPDLLLIFSGQQLDRQYNKTDQKNKDADAVNAMHITNPLIFWTVRVFFTQVEVFSYLFPDSHKIDFCYKLQVPG